MVRYSALLQVLAFSLASAFSTPYKPMVKKFSSLVIFGDSYTDQGVHQYAPINGATVAVPVSYKIFFLYFLFPFLPMSKLIYNIRKPC